MPGCIFCGGTPTTKTHVFRKAWLERLMPNGEAFIHRHVREGERPFDVTWSRDTFDVQPHAACDPCNSGWMHRLEHRGEALVEPCVLGQQRRVFTPNTHATLARWITVCGLVVDQTQAKPQVGVDLAALLRTEAEPPSACHVWIAATDSGEDSVNMWPRALLLESSANTGNAYLCTFRIKHFVAQVYVGLDRTAKEVAFDRIATADYVSQVWPSIGDAPWPPRSVIPGDQVENFAKSFG